MTAAHFARRLILSVAIAVCALAPTQTVPVMGETAQFTPRDETPEEFPAGPGRDETFYACTACHNFKLVAAQGMNRRQWEDSIDWMITRHNMPPLDDADRKVVLDYLEQTYPPRAPSGGGWQNPFLKR